MGLQETLARVVAAIPETVTHSRDLLQWFAMAKQDGTGAAALLHYQIFHDPLLQHRYVEHDRTVDSTRRLAFSYAVWVSRRAQLFGVEQALREFEELRTGSHLGYHAVIVLRQLTVAGAHDLGRGVTLLPWDDVPITGTKEEFTWHRHALATAMNGHAALVIRYQMPNVPFGTMEYFVEEERHRGDAVPRLFDALAAMTFATDVAVVPVALYMEQDQDMPTVGGWSSFRSSDPNASVTWTDVQTAATRSLNGDLALLTPAFRRAVLALSRHLASAVRADGDPAEACSRLGIALETAFLADDEASELQYRLSTRAARYVGGTQLEGRRDLRKTVKAFYDLRSKAVHRGQLTEKQMRGNAHVQVIRRTSEIVRLAARRAITDRQFPDWSDFDLEDAPRTSVPFTPDGAGSVSVDDGLPREQRAT